MKSTAVFTYFAVMAVVAVACWSGVAELYFGHCQEVIDLTGPTGCR